MPRPTRRTVVIVTAAVAVVLIAVGLPLFQPWRVFTNTVVDEALPGAAPPASTPPASVSPSSPSTQPSSTTPPTVSASPKASPKTSPAETPTETPTKSADTGPATLARGTLISHEHDTTGTVAILRLADGSRVLRLEGLDTSDGPDLEVWLSDAEVKPGRAGWHLFDDGRYHDLGDLKGNKGNQNYPIPADIDLADFRSVSIWCDRFNVSFGAATLA
jgi:Electron transfer DM13